MTTQHGSAHGHVPVLLDRVVDLLSPALSTPGAVCVDATLGRGGHAAALLERHPELRLVGVDRDDGALGHCAQRLAAYADRVTYVRARFDDALRLELPGVLHALGRRDVDGVLFDLGVSSPQLDDPERGFAYSHEAPLDMRMDTTQPLTAADVVTTYSRAELTRILREYGEERFAARIAAAIVAERGRAPVRTTRHLAEVVRDAIPAATRRTGGHPAKRSFQALRIEVNAELAAVAAALPAALANLAVGGRIVVLAYHSLEDRIVKRELADQTVDRTPAGLPVTLPGHEPRFRALTRGAEQPPAEEAEHNPRAASARLRAAERVRPQEGRNT